MIQSQNKYQQQLKFDDPNVEITKQSIDMLNKKMQAEEQKIKELEEVTKDVVA